jgi:ubiquinone/menaquinone biosynthesis C-methylase UbiE
VPGCGDSVLNEKMVTNLGVKHVLGIDFEEAVLETMRARGVGGCSYQIMDMTNMKELENESIDLSIDKATYDALCADKSTETRQKCFKYLSETTRVLKEDGSYLAVSLL